ncbi:unnamed protein product [Eruca vesicaria subsp. sativa]|uniref:Uncharacterized protein n=1 Tax=Eruca vesicaria subsp. sativa TaxID=29727 RepID=A0ABC8IZC1_ERUVS|nr:unnamed protein product [Eruca vesicaria subsp. sativa]
MATNTSTAQACPAFMKATSNGVFQGDNPIDFASTFFSFSGHKHSKTQLHVHLSYLLSNPIHQIILPQEVYDFTPVSSGYRYGHVVFETVQQPHDVPFGSYFEVHGAADAERENEILVRYKVIVIAFNGLEVLLIPCLITGNCPFSLNSLLIFSNVKLTRSNMINAWLVLITLTPNVINALLVLD